jgi:peptidoglycan/LPS O-acetylase OafA/YrhL
VKHDSASLAERLGHQAERIILPAGVGAVLADLAIALGLPGDALFTHISTACHLLFMAAIVASVLHDPADCLVCADECSLDDADALAEHHNSSLRGFHLLADTLTLLIGGVVHLWILVRRPKTGTTYSCSFGLALAAVLSPLVIANFLVPGPWLGILLTVILIFVMTVLVRHRRLESRCPWCHGGGRGDDDTEDVPDPDPDPANGKQINA